MKRTKSELIQIIIGLEQSLKSETSQRDETIKHLSGEKEKLETKIGSLNYVIETDEMQIQELIKSEARWKHICGWTVFIALVVIVCRVILF